MKVALWTIQFLPTNPLEFANPCGYFSDLDFKSRAAEFAAPADKIK